MKKIYITILLIIMVSSVLNAAGRRIVIDSLKVDDSEMLFIDFHAEGLIDDKISEGLLKGRTSTLEYKVQLWGKKAGILNQLIHENYIRFKLSYDFWDKKYVVLSQKESRMTTSIETVRDKTSEFFDHPMIDCKKLNSEIQYVLSIEANLKPLSVENYEEIKSWLSGEIKDIDIKKVDDPKNQEQGVKSGVLRMFMAITGFGDKIINGKSRPFIVEGKKVSFK